MIAWDCCSVWMLPSPTATLPAGRQVPKIPAGAGTGLASGERALPRRSFSSVKEFENYLKADKEIIADVTEYRIEHPADNEKQKESYSGKKKPIQQNR